MSSNAVYILGWEVKNIMRMHTFIKKHGWKATGGAWRKLARSARVISSFQSRTACVEPKSFYNSKIADIHFIYGRANKNWHIADNCMGKDIHRVVKETWNVRSGESEPGGTRILQDLLGAACGFNRTGSYFIKESVYVTIWTKHFETGGLKFLVSSLGLPYLLICFMGIFFSLVPWRAFCMTRPPFLKWMRLNENPTLLLRFMKHPVFSNMSAKPCRVGVVYAY